MSEESLKTTVYLGASDYRRLRALAREEGRAAAALVREAVTEYVARRGRSAHPRSLGAFHSGRKDLGERSEALLKGLGRP